MRRVWRCRACGWNNDFDAIEDEWRGVLRGAGTLVMLLEYRCILCEFAVKVDPLWLADTGDRPSLIETGFEAVAG